MNGEKLYEAMGMIGDKYLAELEAYDKKRKRILPAFAAGIAAAACFCVIAAGALILPKITGGPIAAPVTSAAETAAPDTAPPDTSVPVVITAGTSPTETSAPVIITSDANTSDTSVSETTPPVTSASETTASTPQTSASSAVTAPDDDDENPGGGPVSDDIDDDDSNPGGGGGRTDGYIDYGAPVMPLTLLNADSDITAKRNTVFDYSEWDDNDFYPDISVTDEYILTNSSSEDKNITVVYPFVRQAVECDKYMPALTIDGKKAKQTVRAGVTMNEFFGRDRDRLVTREDYKRFLTDKDYFDRAVNYKLKNGDTPVTVYKFSDMKSALEPESRDIFYYLRVFYNCDTEKTKLIAYNLYESTDGTYLFHDIEHPENTENNTTAYIIVFGEDIADLRYDFYTSKNDGAVREEMPEGSASLKLTRTETILEAAMREMLYDYRTDYDKEWQDMNQKLMPIDFDCFYYAFCECLERNGAFSEDKRFYRIDLSAVSGGFSCDPRAFYVMADVTVPACGSVNVTAEMKNNLVFSDFCALAFGTVHGYDLSTSWGTNLKFTELSAGIKNCSSLDVTNENFGFDLKKGITRVSLDPGVERYYIEAKKLFQKKTPADDEAVEYYSDGMVYFSPPVFPLTLAEADGDITAERNVAYDFANSANVTFIKDISVRDEYILKNSSANDKTVKIAYPFISFVPWLDNYLPTLAVNGEKAEAKLKLGGYTGDYLGYEDEEPLDPLTLDKWERYEKFLSDEKQLDRTLNYVPDFGGTPVTVYKITDAWTTMEKDNSALPMLRVSYTRDKNTRVYLCNIGVQTAGEDGKTVLEAAIGYPNTYNYGVDAYIIAVGGDISDMTMEYYLLKDNNEREEIPGGAAGAALTRYEADLDSALKDAVKLLRKSGNGASIPISFDEYYRVCCEYYDNNGFFGDGGGEVSLRLPLSFLDTFRVVYLTAEITVPANSSTSLCISMDKFAFYGDPPGDEDYLNCDQMSAKMGSNLKITALSAEINDRGAAGLVRENYGFDLKNNIRKVELDPNIDRYYFEAKRIKATPHN